MSVIVKSWPMACKHFRRLTLQGAMSGKTTPLPAPCEQALENCPGPESHRYKQEPDFWFSRSIREHHQPQLSPGAAEDLLYILALDVSHPTSTHRCYGGLDMLQPPLLSLVAWGVASTQQVLQGQEPAVFSVAHTRHAPTGELL